MKTIIVCVILAAILGGCSMIPGTHTGIQAIKYSAANFKELASLVQQEGATLDCAIAYNIGANIARSSNAKLDLVELKILPYVNTNLDVYKNCYKAGLFGAYTGVNAEITVQRFLEWVGTIN
jgi:hypothetical protein